MTRPQSSMMRPLSSMAQPQGSVLKVMPNIIVTSYRDIKCQQEEKEKGEARTQELLEKQKKMEEEKLK